jgi:hypothetical protein
MRMPDSLLNAARRARRYPHLRTVAEIVGAVLLLSGGATAAAAVIPSATSTTIHGCANTRTGALSVLLKSGASCPKGTKALSWNTTGPRGPQGPAGTAALFGTHTNWAGTSTGGGATCTLGQIILTAGDTEPDNTMHADGQILPINGNQALFSLLGKTYGGNGTTTFALPNLKKAAPDGLSYSICISGIFP